MFEAFSLKLNGFLQPAQAKSSNKHREDRTVDCIMLNPNASTMRDCYCFCVYSDYTGYHCCFIIVNYG